MPCYLRTRITYTEKWKVRPDLLEQALSDVIKELQSIYGTRVDFVAGKESVTIYYAGQSIRIDLANQKLVFTQGQESVKNMLKRAYSRVVVKTAALKSNIRSKFTLKQTEQNKFLLQRRVK